MRSMMVAAFAGLVMATPAQAQLRASLLPNVRAVQVDGDNPSVVTVFATMINASDSRRENCRVVLPDGGEISLSYQTTDPATNALTGSPDTPFSLPPRGAQSLLLAFSGADPFDGELAPSFRCRDTVHAPVSSGVNTLQLSLSYTAEPDIIPVSLALPDLDGTVKTNRAGGAGLMAVAAVNIGAEGEARIRAIADDATGTFPGAVLICETDPNGLCLEPYAAYVDAWFAGNQSRTFNALLLSPEHTGIAFAPATTRLNVEFRHDERLAAQTGAAVLSPEPANLAISYEEAARFLVQAGYGPSMEEVRRLAQIGIDPWLDQQFAMAIDETHFDYVVRGGPPGCSACEAQYINAFTESIWRQAVIGEDQLRQRMAFALSEIFVVSANNARLGNEPRALAAYYDLMAANAFGNYRDLIEDVARSPAMGVYLSHMANERGDAETGRIPDENFAREVMQLFAIGLWELNPDGSRRLDGDREPIATYGQEEISGMARVFTGWSWGGGDTTNGRWNGRIFYPDPFPWEVPMQMYERFHEPGEKRIISGVVIPAGTSGEESLEIALDALHEHPNTPPFISRQLIQRFVPSNPSPEYIGRVSAVFMDNGQGVRGDLAAVLRAVLTDEEARDPANIGGEDWGKLREPVTRFSAWMRGFDAAPAADEDGRYRIGYLSDPVDGLGQAHLFSPSVFNFFRPDYAPPGEILNAGLVAPEFQITHETTVTGYANFMMSVVNGWNWRVGGLELDYGDEAAYTTTPSALVERLNIILAAGMLSDETKASITAAVASIEDDEWEAAGRRLAIALQLVLTAPEFIVQQ
jgi:uncharacterized protein (DUF1800 family)